MAPSVSTGLVMLAQAVHHESKDTASCHLPRKHVLQVAVRERQYEIHSKVNKNTRKSGCAEIRCIELHGDSERYRKGTVAPDNEISKD